ncbi:MAG TPA: hypothetical protein VMV33_11995 [Rhodocyclaceae bacterium]|nr:hypothetical protein [Rhodocyclaceae bacterium]
MLSNGRRTLLLLAVVSVLPLLTAYVVFLNWRPAHSINHGELIATHSLPSAQLSDLAGKPFSSDVLHGKWQLVTIQPPSCDQRCQRSLYYIRQVRLAQGENMSRVGRLWLLSGAGAPDPKLLAEHPGLLVARAQNPAWLSAFPAKEDRSAHIYLIDPLGNFVLRYDDGADPKGMIKDLTRLLQVSQIG